jgi:hypothetical protein
VRDPGPHTVDEAILFWCRDTGAGAPRGATTESMLGSAYAVLASFISERCRALGMSDPSVAEDVAHLVLERLSRLPAPPEHPRAYVAQAVRHALVDHHRLQLRSGVDPAILDLLVDPAPLVIEGLSAADEAMAVRALLDQWLERCFATAEGRMPGSGSRMRASLHLLEAEVTEGAGMTETPAASALRSARRHRQAIEDDLYEALRRAHAYSRSAPSRLAACPSRHAALEAPARWLLGWVASMPASDDAREFIELWLCFLAFRNRYRTRSVPVRAE